MEQPALFHEDLNAALGHLISALGGPKVVGSSMWPAITPPDKAGRKISDCLNDNHQQRFSGDDILWLLREGRRAGVHSAMAFIAAQCGYELPRPIEPEDARAKLQRDYIEATKAMGDLVARMERLETASAQDDTRPYPIRG